MTQRDITKEPYAESFTLRSLTIYRAGDDETPYANIMQMAQSLQYHEDIMLPAYGAELVVVDNAKNLMSSMPIQGFEKVVLQVDMLGEPYTYTFRVWTVANRVNSDRRQIYTLGLISEEGLINEGVRVNRIIEGETSAAVKKVMHDYLGVDQIDAEPSATKFKVLPTKKTPFSLIRSLQTKTVSASTSPPTVGSIVEPITGDEKGLTKPFENTGSDVNETQKTAGTAGYLFYQTRVGYVFRSFDSLSSSKEDEFDGKEPVQTYTYSAGKTDRESNTNIHDIVFGQEINMLKKLREGSYSSLVGFFNINTGQYEEYVYSLADTWKDMVHLGSQTRLPAGQTKLSQYPTRIMSTVIDNEAWYNGTEVASEKSEYPDFQKHYLSQSYSRAGIMFNQQLTISLSGQLGLVAGNKIEIRIPNQKPDSERKKEPWDPEHSGTYLIKNLNHQFNISDKKVHTVLDLIRDSYGIKSNESNVR